MVETTDVSPIIDEENIDITEGDDTATEEEESTAESEEEDGGA